MKSNHRHFSRGAEMPYCTLGPTIDGTFDLLYQVKSM